MDLQSKLKKVFKEPFKVDYKPFEFRASELPKVYKDLNDNIKVNRPKEMLLLARY